MIYKCECERKLPELGTDHCDSRGGNCHFILSISKS